MCDELKFNNDQGQNVLLISPEHNQCVNGIEGLLERTTTDTQNVCFGTHTQRSCVSRLVASFTRLPNCKFALFCHPTPVMDKIGAGTHTAITNEQDRDSDSGGDPFQNCRLSEMVANMLDSDCDSNSAVNETEQGEYEITTTFVDYNTEPRNKELFRDSARNMEVFDLSDNFTGITDTCMDMNLPTDCIQDSHCNDSDTNNVFDDTLSFHDQHIRTIVGRSTETVFGVLSPQDNEDTKIEDKIRMETEFGPTQELKNAKYRWSVTSV